MICLETNQITELPPRCMRLEIGHCDSPVLGTSDTNLIGLKVMMVAKCVCDGSVNGKSVFRPAVCVCVCLLRGERDN